mmetsp:Transcript_108958/g.216386  ORF Transcript_108958/g.216386 Transcript_108958/m.216386 type:complete len:223 (-) Transcript_108958:748-1416(-)
MVQTPLHEGPHDESFTATNDEWRQLFVVTYQDKVLNTKTEQQRYVCFWSCRCLIKKCDKKRGPFLIVLQTCNTGRGPDCAQNCSTLLQKPASCLETSCTLQMLRSFIDLARAMHEGVQRKVAGCLCCVAPKNYEWKTYLSQLNRDGVDCAVGHACHKRSLITWQPCTKDVNDSFGLSCSRWPVHTLNSFAQCLNCFLLQLVQVRKVSRRKMLPCTLDRPAWK